MTRAEAGRWLLSGAGAATITGGFLADWNHTHLFNPAWTPHARFHDAWTILPGAGLGAIALRALWRDGPDVELAALLTALFWATQAGSHAFPGAAGIASELPAAADRVGVTKVPEGVASAAMLALTAAGYALAAGDRRA